MLKQDPMKYAKTEARRRARPQEGRLRLLPIGVSKMNMMDGGKPYNKNRGDQTASDLSLSHV